MYKGYLRDTQGHSSVTTPSQPAHNAVASPSAGAALLKYPSMAFAALLPLASHILSLAARQLPHDWLAAYRVQPVLLETLVDGTRYQGGCYRAANWTEVGLTQGRGRMDFSGKAQGVRKHIFLFPLHRHWRERLCDRSRSLPRSLDEPAGNLR